MALCEKRIAILVTYDDESTAPTDKEIESEVKNAIRHGLLDGIDSQGEVKVKKFSVMCKDAAE